MNFPEPYKSSCQALPCGSRAGAGLWVECQVVRIYRKGIAAPGALQFELQQSVSTSERSIYHTQVGLEPTEAE